MLVCLLFIFDSTSHKRSYQLKSHHEVCFLKVAISECIFFLVFVSVKRKRIARQTKTKPIYHSSKSPITEPITTTTIEQDHKNTSLNDHKRSELVHKEDKSFWRSWFGFGSSYDSDSDSDDDKRKKNVLKFNENNSNRPGGPKLSTRKSSAERQTNFNCPTEEEREAAKLAKRNRASSVRSIR